MQLYFTILGAALKIGQMLSIQDKSLINPQISKIFERVQQSADYMPNWQIVQVLTEEFGSNWSENFSEFDQKPFAAASIGTIHILRKQFYSTKINLTSKFFSKTFFFVK